jgi:hypothetical protein
MFFIEDWRNKPKNLTESLKRSIIVWFIMHCFCFADTVAGDLHDILELNINAALKSLSITQRDTNGVLQAINCSFAANSGVRLVYFLMYDTNYCEKSQSLLFSALVL